MIDKYSYNQKIQQSWKNVGKEDFWVLFWNRLDDLRNDARDRCEDNKEDIRFHQGRARAMKEILALPDRIMEELQENVEK